MKAFLLVETVLGKNMSVIAALKQLKEVKSVDFVTGPYDIIAIVETSRDFGDFITTKINIEGISRAVTCLVINILEAKH